MEIYNDTYSVYVHINKINGLMYFGTTSKYPASKRWCRNGIGYKVHNTRFYNAIQEFGWDNFEHEVIASNLTETEASHMEQLLVEHFNTRNPKFGYNIDKAGLCKSEAQRRQKISESVSGEKHPLYGTTRPQETKDKIREALSGENGYWYGKKMPEYVGVKISEKMKGNTNYKKHVDSQKKAIVCIETGIEYESLAEAERATGVHHSAVSNVLNGKRNTAGGYHWKFV